MKLTELSFAMDLRTTLFAVPGVDFFATHYFV